MTTTKITTKYSRELTVKNSEYDVNLHVKDTDGFYSQKGEVYTGLTHGEAAQLAAALVGDNATVITDLPEAAVDPSFNHAKTVIRSGEVIRYITSDPAKLVANAKQLLAIAAFITKHNAEQEEAKKAEAEAVKAKEAARAKRGDELAVEFRGWGTYADSSAILQKSIDRIITLEEAAKVS